MNGTAFDSEHDLEERDDHAEVLTMIGTVGIRVAASAIIASHSARVFSDTRQMIGSIDFDIPLCVNMIETASLQQLV